MPQAPKPSPDEDDYLDDVRFMLRLKRARKIAAPASVQFDLAASDLSDDHLDEIREMFDQ